MKRRPVVAAVLVATLVIFSGSLWVASLLTHRDAPAGGQAHTQSATATAALAPSAHPTWPGYTSRSANRKASTNPKENDRKKDSMYLNHPPCGAQSVQSNLRRLISPPFDLFILADQSSILTVSLH